LSNRSENSSRVGAGPPSRGALTWVVTIDVPSLLVLH
jgi:hypothetical protein